MPRNGSGVAERLPNTTAVSGQKIESAVFNSVVDDIIATFNEPWPASLLPSYTEYMAKSGGAFTGGITGTSASFSTTFNASGAATFGSTVNATGAVTLTSTLAVSGASTLAALTASGAAVFNGSATFNGAVTYAGALTFSKGFGLPYTTLVDAATIALNLDSGANFKVTLSGNRTLGAATGGVAGQRAMLEVTQDATGGRTLNLSNSVYKWPGGTVQPISTIAAHTTQYEIEVITPGLVYRIRKIWESGRNSIGFYREFDLGTLNGIGPSTTTAHGLAQRPALIAMYLECAVADVDYAVGDRVIISGGQNVSGNNRGLAIAETATNFIVRYSDLSGQIFLHDSTGTNSSIAASRWRLIVRVYL